MKQFALPVVGLAVIAAYWLWRGTADAPGPTAAPPSTPPAARPTDSTTARDPGGAPGSTSKAPTVRPAGSSTPAPAEPTKTTRRDRKDTERLREQLRTMHRAGASRTSAGQVEEPAPEGKLDAAYIQARIREDLVPIAQECYESALEDDPKLGGKLVMSFSIVGDPSVGGVVDEADADPSSEIKQPDLLECMKESMLSLSFPPPEDGGTVSVTCPFVFAADGPPPAKP
jgi:hypothetical protein